MSGDENDALEGTLAEPSVGTDWFSIVGRDIDLHLLQRDLSGEDRKMGGHKQWSHCNINNLAGCFLSSRKVFTKQGNVRQAPSNTNSKDDCNSNCGYCSFRRSLMGIPGCRSTNKV